MADFDTFEDFIENTRDDKLLYSQRCFLMSQYPETLLASGVGSGKTYIMIIRAILLSFFNPDNFGLIGRDTETNLEGTTKKDFFEICPPDLIVSEKKSEKLVKLRSYDPRKTSSIVFRHFLEVNTARHHFSGMNLGFYCADQLEDCEEAQWNYLQTRLRRKSVNRHYAFGIANTKGRDWVYYRFFAEAIKSGRKDVTMVPGLLGETVEVEEYRTKANPDSTVLDRYAIRAPTAENVHLPPDYLKRMLRNQSREYLERYVYASFDEWGGKIYKEFKEDGVHVIHPFHIPEKWPTICSIDIGGDTPWAALTIRCDPLFGDLFITNEFYQPNTITQNLVDWVRDAQRSGIPDPRPFGPCRFICDPANKAIMMELMNRGISCEAARKGLKNPGIFLVAGYMHPKPGREKLIPDQPGSRGQLRDVVVNNAPHLWVFNHCENFIREHAQWQWQRDARTGLASDKSVDRDDHTVDAMIYGCRVCPPVEDLPKANLSLEALRKTDFYSYQEALRVHRMKHGDEADKRVGNEMLVGESGEMDRIYKNTQGKPW